MPIIVANSDFALTMLNTVNTEKIENPWLTRQATWSHAYGVPIASGVIKAQPSDFLVTEEMPVNPTGAGEHVWLRVRKERQNTEAVAKQIARFCNVAYREVSYSGMKDLFAITEQWFSVRLPISTSLEWSGFSMPGVELVEIARHSRKLKRGTHSANRFEILIRDFAGSIEEVEQRLEQVSMQGVPNYFGPQRFGRQGNNVPQALDVLSGRKKIKNRPLKGLLISAARSWLYNEILSARIDQNTWCSLQTMEPANLEGTSSTFEAENTKSEAERLTSLDIHPTAPLWGNVESKTVSQYMVLYDWEKQQVSDYLELMAGLEKMGASYQRRALRMKVHDLSWDFQAQELRLCFRLNKGGFATSVLREIVSL